MLRRALKTDGLHGKPHDSLEIMALEDEDIDDFDEEIEEEPDVEELDAPDDLEDVDVVEEIAPEDLLEVEEPIVEVEEEETETTKRRRKREKEEEEEEDDDDELDDDVEASLDEILKERLVVEEPEDDEEDQPEPDDRGDIATKVLPKQPGEFVCQSCFLVKKGTQLADKKRHLCRDCV